LILSRIRLISW